MGKLRYFAKWLFHYIISPLVPHIPFPILRRTGAVLGILNYFIHADLRRRIEKNMGEVLTEKTPEEIRKICRLNFINHAMHSLEILYLPAVNEKFVRKYINVKNFESPKKALEKGNGIILILGHFGFYYLSGVSAQVLGVPMNDISQDTDKLKISKLDRKILMRRLNNYQSRISGKVFHRGGALLGVVKAVKRNEAISLFVDALTTEKDPVVTFLGRKTRAPQGPIRISMQTGAAIIFAPAIRENNGDMTIAFYDPFELENTGAKEQDLQRNAQRLTNLLEPVIRQYPDQWHLWRIFHERCIKEDGTERQRGIESADSGA